MRYVFTEGTPPARWRWARYSGVTTAQHWLIAPDGEYLFRAFADEQARDRILTTLNEAEALRAELGLHKLNEKGQCPVCYDAGYEDGAEALRERLRLAEVDRDAWRRKAERASFEAMWMFVSADGVCKICNQRTGRYQVEEYPTKPHTPECRIGELAVEGAAYIASLTGAGAAPQEEANG